MNDDKGVFWMDYESVLANFVRCHLNWDPELFKYSKSTFDYWSVEKMRQYDSLVTLKENPQYFIKFAPSQDFIHNDDVIKCWVAISKLMVTHKNGEFEAEESAKDYIAMHVYPTDRPN